MTQQHTPGPWTGEPAGEAMGIATFQVATLRDANGVSEVTARPVFGEANARLIAAAPELLAALKVIVLTPGILAHLEATDPMALDQARAAIAKATSPQAR